MLNPLHKNIYSLEAGATCEHIFYEQQRDNWSILSRSGRAVAHDEEPSRHSNGWRISFDRAIVNQKRKEMRRRSPASELSVLERDGNAVPINCGLQVISSTAQARVRFKWQRDPRALRRVHRSRTRTAARVEWKRINTDYCAKLCALVVSTVCGSGADVR